jgi:hypothetical protein
MSDIIDFMAFKKAKAEAISSSESPQDKFKALVKRCNDFLLKDWENMTRTNKLNKYFIQAMAHVITQDLTVNYIRDLNALAMIELNLNLNLIIFAPGTMTLQQRGWRARFYIGENLIYTPELGAESYARCFAILMNHQIRSLANGLNIPLNS